MTTLEDLQNRAMVPSLVIANRDLSKQLADVEGKLQAANIRANSLEAGIVDVLLYINRRNARNAGWLGTLEHTETKLLGMLSEKNRVHYHFEDLCPHCGNCQRNACDIHGLCRC